MKRLYMIITLFLLIFLAVTVNAATAGKKVVKAGKKTATEVSTSGVPETPDVTEAPQGLTNLQKVMLHRIDRSKKMHKKIEGPSGN